MNDEALSNPTTVGHAFRITSLGTEPAEAYEGVYVQLDSVHGVAHVFSADQRTHFLTIPIGAALIEWQDPAELQPQLRIPALGGADFEQLMDLGRQQMQQVGELMGEHMPQFQQMFQPMEPSDEED